MALANVAWWSARECGMRVLVVDWDLEAPGLHRFFRVRETDIKRGLIDLLFDYKQLLTGDKSINRARPIDIRKYCQNDVCTFEGDGTISCIFAGRQDSSYSNRITGFDWDDFYENWYGFSFFEYLKCELKKDYDLILIDSRTGVTDIGGICTIQLPDTVILLFSYNEQSLEGVVHVGRSIRDQSPQVRPDKSQPSLLVVPSRIEKYLEQDHLRNWEHRAAERAVDLMNEFDRSRGVEYMIQEAIPYVGEFAFGERIAAEVDPQRELAMSYRELTGRILKECEYERQSQLLLTSSSKAHVTSQAVVRSSKKKESPLALSALYLIMAAWTAATVGYCLERTLHRLFSSGIEMSYTITYFGLATTVLIVTFQFILIHLQRVYLTKSYTDLPPPLKEKTRLSISAGISMTVGVLVAPYITGQYLVVPDHLVIIAGDVVALCTLILQMWLVRNRK